MAAALRRVCAAALLALAAAGAAAAQVCTRPTADTVDCGYLNPEPEAMAVKAVARLRHVRGPPTGAVTLVLDGRTCSTVAAHWQLGAGEAEAVCVQKGGYERHRAQARLYDVAGATPVSLDLTVEPYRGGLERLPLDTGRLSRAKPHRRGLGRLWPF